MFDLWSGISGAIAVIAVAIAMVKRPKEVLSSDRRAPVLTGIGLSMVFGLLAYGLVDRFSGGEPSLRGLSFGFMVGAVGLMIGWGTHRPSVTGLATIALSAVALMLPVSASSLSVPMAAGMAAGLAGSALLGRGTGRRSILGVQMASVGALLMAAVISEMGTAASGLVMTLLAPAAIGALVLAFVKHDETNLFPRLVAAVLSALISYAASVQLARVESLPELRYVPLIAGAVAIASLLFLGKSLSTPRLLLVGLVTTATGTLAFTLGRGEGIALAAGIFVVIAVISAEATMLLASLPLVMLATLRAFRSLITTPNLTFELNFHHQIIALIFAALVVVALYELRFKDARQGPAVGGLSAVALGCVVTAGLIAFGTRAPNGLILGAFLGAFLFSPIADAIRSARPAVNATLLAALSMAMYPLLAPNLDATRDQKLQSLLIVVGIAFVAVVPLILICRPFAGVEASEKGSA